MIPTAPRLERVAIWAMAAYGLVLPFEGIGAWSPRATLGMQVCDLVVLVASPLLVALIWRARTNLARAPLLWACAGLAAATVASDVLRRGDGATLALGAKQGVLLLTVCSLAAAGAAGHSTRIVVAVCVGGAAAVVVSLLGYLWAIVSAGPANGDLPFVLETAHPIFAGLPRLTGTFGNSPQEMGEFAVVLLATLWCACLLQPRPRVSLRASLIVAGVALVITFSSAWVGGLVLVAGLVVARWPRRTVYILTPPAVALVVALTFVAMNFGPPLRPEIPARLHAFPCDSGETEHFVTWSIDARATTCKQVPMSWPYQSILTTYWQAKKTAWAAFSAAPLVGHGRDGYRIYATEAFRRKSGGRVLGVFYDRPHCTPLDAVTACGALGGLALALLLYAIVRRRPAQWSAPATPLWLGVIGLVLVGLNIDILERRPFWALVGLLAAVDFPARSARREDLPEVLDRTPDAVVECDPRLPAQ